MLFVVPPNFFMGNFSWGGCKSQKKLKTVPMQNFGGTTKSIMIFLKKVCCLVNQHGRLVVVANLEKHGRHLFPSTKLTFSSQWLSQDNSLFLNEISLSLETSVRKSLSLFNC